MLLGGLGFNFFHSHLDACIENNFTSFRIFYGEGGKGRRVGLNDPAHYILQQTCNLCSINVLYLEFEEFIAVLSVFNHTPEHKNTGPIHNKPEGGTAGGDVSLHRRYKPLVCG